MPVIPIALTIPAALASLAYLNARWSVPNDWNLISSLARSRIQFRRRERQDHVSSFYILEDLARSSKTANKPFLIYGTRSWTFAQTYENVLRFAGWLHQTHDVKPREIIAIDFMNSPAFLFLTIAIWSLGATPAFINYNLTGSPLINAVRVSTARLLIVDPEAQHTINPEASAAFSSPTFRNNAFPLSVVILDTGLQSSLDHYPPYRAPDSARSGILPRNPAVLISTSGTTGNPKSAVVPWDRLAVGSGFAARFMGLRPTNSSNPDRFYTCMPMYHSTAFILGFHLCLTYGVTLVIGHRFSSKSFWDEVRATDSTVIQYVGETLRYLLAAPPRKEDTEHRVRMAFGNGLRPDVWEKFKSRFGVETVVELYGSTEANRASFNVSSNSFSSGAIGRNGTIGELILNREQAIVKVDWETELPYRSPKTGLCEKVPRGDVGELLYALNPADIEEKFQGYFGDEKSTESKILRDVIKKGDAWFRTGDVVRWDREGRMWFNDRIGDTYRWKSENVSTSEVGEVLGLHQRVVEANVFGVSIPGHEGRAGCAALLLDGKPTPEVMEEIAALATKSLPKFAVPVFVRVVREIQATGNNKQQKHILRKEGVDPDLVNWGDKLFWLKPGSDSGKPAYVPFERTDWDKLKKGGMRL